MRVETLMSLLAVMPSDAKVTVGFDEVNRVTFHQVHTDNLFVVRLGTNRPKCMDGDYEDDDYDGNPPLVVGGVPMPEVTKVFESLVAPRAVPTYHGDYEPERSGGATEVPVEPPNPRVRGVVYPDDPETVEAALRRRKVLGMDDPPPHLAG